MVWEWILVLCEWILVLWDSILVVWEGILVSLRVNLGALKVNPRSGDGFCDLGNDFKLFQDGSGWCANGSWCCGDGS